MTNTQREPMLRDSKWVEKDMRLPEGKTCGDCVHIKRCKALFGHIEADQVCDWAPSRFVAFVPVGGLEVGK